MICDHCRQKQATQVARFGEFRLFAFCDACVPVFEKEWAAFRRVWKKIQREVRKEK